MASMNIDFSGQTDLQLTQVFQSALAEAEGRYPNDPNLWSAHQSLQRAAKAHLSASDYQTIQPQESGTKPAPPKKT